MSGRPNRSFKFWQELKRRRVFKTLAMYAASAFIILEVVDIVAPSLGLPGWTLNVAIILLIAGFPVTAVLSWIFDLTPEGIKKTEPLHELKEVEPDAAPRRRKLRTSDVVIVVLLAIVGILAYPKIFSKDRFEQMGIEHLYNS